MAEFYSDIELPDFTLGGGPLGARFAALGIRDFHTAVRHVWQLPYGRNRSRGLPIEVLDEGRGTCSTKHALLAATAAECGAPVELWLCIYEMREANTPGVGPILQRHALTYIPEAHCYLASGEARIDVTRTVAASERPLDSIRDREPISPEQVDTYKPAYHRRYLTRWLEEGNAAHIPDLDRLWEIREACIASL